MDLNDIAKCGLGPARGSFWQKKPFARPPRCSHGFDRGKCLNGSSPTLSVLQNPVAHASEAPAPAWGSQGMHPEAKSGRVGTGGRASGRCLKSSFLAHLVPAALGPKNMKSCGKRGDLSAEKGPGRIGALVLMILETMSVFFTHPHPQARFHSRAPSCIHRF